MISQGQIPFDTKKMSTEVLDLYVKLKVEEETRLLRQQTEAQRINSLQQIINPRTKRDDLEDAILQHLTARFDPSGRFRARHSQPLADPYSCIEQKAVEAAINVGSKLAENVLPDLVRSILGLGPSRSEEPRYENFQDPEHYE